MKKCLIYIDPDDVKNSVDLIEVANQIYDEERFETYGIKLSSYDEETEDVFDHVIDIKSDEEVNLLDAMVITDLLEGVHGEYGFDCIIIPATFTGRMIAPRLAMRLHTGLVADVTDINRDETLELIRPAFSGKIMAAIRISGNGPIMLTVRPNVFTPGQLPWKNTNVISYSFLHTRKSRITLMEKQEKESIVNIQESDVLVSGGNGVVRNFEKLYALADELNGMVSASRKIVDEGIVSRSVQVGQSGKTVQPKLYMALGINGSIQHIEGLKNIDHIISVNTNVNAPICSLSDIVVEGDASLFIDKLINKIQQKK